MEKKVLRDNESLKQMCVKILCPDCHSFVDNWLDTATKNEVKGLKVTFAIVKHEGKKKFKPLNKSSADYASVDQLRKKYLKSYYNSEFCQESSKKNSDSDILKYKNLRDLKCSKVLSSASLLFVERWLGLKDEQEYQSLMLTFLRGIHSVTKIQGLVPNTAHRDYFEWIPIEKNFRNLAKISMTPSKINPKREKDGKSKSIGVSKLLKERAYNFSPQELKVKTLRGLRGYGEITNWVTRVEGNYSSLYQDTYVTPFVDKKSLSKSDFNTSLVCKLLPDKGLKN